MSKLKFHKNKHIGLGVEIEIQLIDLSTGDLKPVGPAILSELEKQNDAIHIKSEIFQSMLEIDTPICVNALQVGTSLRKSLDIVRTAATKHGPEIMMAGTHPFAHYSERLLTSSSRYLELVDRNQWITRRLQIFGLHVHLGMRDGRHPCLVNSWEEFEALVDKLISSKSIRTIKDLWWDIRPNLEYGTIEVRIADCPPTIREVEALVALIHSLAAFIDLELSEGREFAPPPEWILRENRWRASRHGVHCELVKGIEGKSVPFVEIWSELQAVLKTVCAKFSYQTFFAFLNSIASEGPSYVRHLIRENKADMPEWRKCV